MRFLANGPRIPDLLLERRDQGRVVFFCGAGVSLNAGMPTFPELAKYVVRFFDPPKDSEIGKAFGPWDDPAHTGPRVPLDQIFHQLYEEYGRNDVNALVAERLAVAGGSTASNEHALVARISADRERNPQVVTTNFDRLFESAIPDCKWVEPPGIPDIELGVPIRGVTYLHGRLRDANAEHHHYVLSSADFGRAYLSEAWATNFIRALLQSYTVVLLGYQAEDPPVKYLLQGLNYDGMSDRTKLYAFDRGAPEEVEAKWRDRGVTAIAYPEHADLWDSLGAWAERADDPRGWRRSVVGLATREPGLLEAHERGQVAHVVRTTAGARLFAASDPSPPPAWLCVFDASCRAGEVSSEYGDDAEVFDPLEAYGLDDDPPRPGKSRQPVNRVHEDLLEWRIGDQNPATAHSLTRRQVTGYEDMPVRLQHLSHWVASNVGSPVTAWWAMRASDLHPRQVRMIRHRLRVQDLHSRARRFWSLLLESQADRRFAGDDRFFELADRIKQEGWTHGALRAFEAATAPALCRSRPLGLGASKPPSGSWAEISLNDLGSWSVGFPDRRSAPIEVPDDVLESVFRIAVAHLHRASGLLCDLDVHYFRTPSCYPDREVDGERDSDATAAFFRWFLGLLARMAQQNSAVLRAYALTWSAEDEYFFRKLLLFALNHSALFEADEVADTLLRIDDSGFWDVDVARELLFLVNDRWGEFSERDRIALADRLLRGPPRSEAWTEEEFPAIRDELASRYTRWLVLQGRVLSDEQSRRLGDLIAAIPNWQDSWASGFVAEHGIRVGFVGVDESAAEIMDLPISRVAERAAELSRGREAFTRRRPFSGLVTASPRKALVVLSHARRRGDYPIELWSDLIRKWPDVAPRLHRVFLGRLSQLPQSVIGELSHVIGRWLHEKFRSVFVFDRGLAWTSFDHLVNGLTSGDGSATDSGLEAVSVDGEIVAASRRTFGYALNGPVGEAMGGLLRALDSLKLENEAGIPEEFKTRIARLLESPGEGRDHAVAILAHYMSWLYFIDPDWTLDTIVPWFDLTHWASEPAWNAHLAAATRPPPQVGERLKPIFLRLLPSVYGWKWDSDAATVVAQMVVSLGVFRRGEPDGLSKREARACLRDMTDETRASAVFHLGEIGKQSEDGWNAHVIPFISEVWPREREFRTSRLARAWVGVLAEAGDCFPAVLGAAQPFLAPIEEEAHYLFRFSREVQGEEPLTVRYPREVLRMLDAIVSNSIDRVPYELSEILQLIEAADGSAIDDRSYLRLIDLIEKC